MSPTIIFEGDIVKQPWEYTLSPKLDENLRSALADYLINLKWDEMGDKNQYKKEN